MCKSVFHCAIFRGNSTFNAIYWMDILIDVHIINGRHYYSCYNKTTYVYQSFNVDTMFLWNIILLLRHNKKLRCHQWIWYFYQVNKVIMSFLTLNLYDIDAKCILNDVQMLNLYSKLVNNGVFNLKLELNGKISLWSFVLIEMWNWKVYSSKLQWHVILFYVHIFNLYSLIQI